jgi:hypothetical protein
MGKDTVTISNEAKSLYGTETLLKDVIGQLRFRRMSRECKDSAIKKLKKILENEGIKNG